jgi:hypothetical protein
MKFQLKALAAAALVCVGGIASAAINTGETGDGELFLLAYDTTSQQTYTFDTGVSMSSFVPGSAAASPFTLDGFNSFLSTSTASTIRWGVYATDRLFPTSLYTTAATGASAINPTLTKLNNTNGALSSFANSTNQAVGTHATQANGSGTRTTPPASPVDFTYGGNILGANNNFSSNLSFNTTGENCSAMRRPLWPTHQCALFVVPPVRAHKLRSTLIS